MAGLMPLIDAQNILLNSARKLDSEIVKITDSLGRITARDICAKRSQPAANMSSMDGYAICYDANITSWDVVGECKAGTTPCDTIISGQAARIFTGALLPEGADTIIIQENITIDGSRASLKPNCTMNKGQHIRREGNDFAQHETIIKAGETITAAKIGLLIAAGHDHISVYKKPQVAIISTGDELREIGDMCEPHQIPASNGPMIAAMLNDCEIVYNKIVKDDLLGITQAIRNNDHCDIIITIGGASVGDHDLIVPALRNLKANINFMKAAIKPGKPILTGKIGDAIIVGLPGNPASAYVTAILFLLPLTGYIMGKNSYMPIEKNAQLNHELPAIQERAEFLRAKVVGHNIMPYTGQDSAKISTLSESNALLIRPSNSPNIATGAMVKYIEI